MNKSWNVSYALRNIALAKVKSARSRLTFLKGTSALKRRTKSVLRTSRSFLYSDRNFISHRYSIFIQAIKSATRSATYRRCPWLRTWRSRHCRFCPAGQSRSCTPIRVDSTSTSNTESCLKITESSKAWAERVTALTMPWQKTSSAFWKTSCYIWKILTIWISSRQSRSSTLTVTITAVSRPNFGACLLLFTEIKPSKLLDLILLSNFWGTEHFRCSFCFRSSQLRKSLSAIYLQFALGGLFYPELCIPA